MRKYLWLAYALPLLALFAIEAAFFTDPWSTWRPIAGFFWVLFAVVVLLSAGVASLVPFFRRDFWAQPDRGWYLLAFFGAPFLVLFGAGGIRFCTVDAEGIQQLAAGVQLLRTDSALGIFSMAYSRYLARQYLLNSLPTLIMGPSLWAARFGNAMFYLVSYAFFLSAVADYLRRRRNPAALLHAAYAGGLLAFGEYALLNARKFEQTTMPLGGMLLFLGALLHFADEPGPLPLLWVTWSVGFFTGCYTPALAGWVLAVGVLLYLVLWRQRWVLLVPVLYGLACLGVAFLIMERADSAALPLEFGTGPERPLTAAGWFLRYLDTVRMGAGGGSALLQAPAAVALGLGGVLAWRRRDWRYATVLGWALVTAFLAVTLIGSAFASPARSLARALVTLPPLLLGTLLLLERERAARPPAPGGILALLMRASVGYMACTGFLTVVFVRSFIGNPWENDQDEVYDLVSRLVTTPGVQPRQFYVVPPLQVDLAAGMPYFTPGAVWLLQPPPPGARQPGTYVFSYRYDDPDERDDNDMAPKHRPRPYVLLRPE
jgi:hypothetical protein